MKTKGHTAITLFGLLLSIILTFVLYGIIEYIQKIVFVPTDYLAFGMNSSGSYLIFFFEIEIIIFMVMIIASKFDFFILKELIPGCVNKKLKRFALVGVIIINVITLCVSVNSVTIITEEGIIVKNMEDFTGKEYSYSQVKSVKAGYETKGRDNGSFYYVVTMDDDNKITLTDCSGNDSIKLEDGRVISEHDKEMNTYLWLEVVDNYIMKNSVTKVSDQSSIENAYSYADVYLKLFERVMENGSSE